MPDPAACRSCGAALAPGADRCALCGTPAGEADALAPESIPSSPALEAAPPEATGAECSVCEHVNPAGSRFCNRCGAPLAARATSPPDALVASGDRPPSDVGRRAVAFVGVAIAAVVGLYALTAVMGDRGVQLEPEPNTEAVPAGVAGAEAATNPLPPGPVPTLPAAQSQSQADTFEAQDTADGYYEAARYYLTAAYEAQQESPESSRLWASRAVSLLEQSLEAEDSLDRRIALAEASAFEGVDPMRPIQEAQAVLTANPGHPGANLFIGQRRLMIGRNDQAREAFQTVLANTEPGDPARASAESALELIESGGIPGVQ